MPASAVSDVYETPIPLQRLKEDLVDPLFMNPAHTGTIQRGGRPRRPELLYSQAGFDRPQVCHGVLAEMELFRSWESAFRRYYNNCEAKGVIASSIANGYCR